MADFGIKLSKYGKKIGIKNSPGAFRGFVYLVFFSMAAITASGKIKIYNKIILCDPLNQL